MGALILDAQFRTWRIPIISSGFLSPHPLRPSYASSRIDITAASFDVIAYYIRLISNSCQDLPIDRVLDRYNHSHDRIPLFLERPAQGRSAPGGLGWEGRGIKAFLRAMLPPPGAGSELGSVYLPMIGTLQLEGGGGQQSLYQL